MGFPANTQGVDTLTAVGASAHRGGGELHGRKGTNAHML
jgi:hypothetical protein